MKNGIHAIRKQLTSASADACLISSYASLSYLTGFFGFSQIERDAYVLITKTSFYLFTNPLYKDAFSQPSPFTLKITSPAHSFVKEFHEICKKERITSILFEEDNLTVSEFSKMQKDGIDFIPDTLSHLRITKTPHEIKLMKSVCKLTDAVFDAFLNSGIQAGITEKELARKLEILVLENNASLSFPTIVAFGKNAAVPHHHTGDTKLKKNDVILLDFGIKKDNYCSDMTRTFFIGKPAATQQKSYEVVLASQRNAAEFIEKKLIKKQKVIAAEADSAARAHIIKHDYPSIPHSLGHGIGIQVHEAPSLSPRSDDFLENGMVFSIEPGIYIPNKFGIRIEDLYAIENNKLVELTKSPKQLITI